jgi:hypothetical protein
MAHPALPAGPTVVPAWLSAIQPGGDLRQPKELAGIAEQEMTVGEQEKAQAVERAARLLGRGDQASWQALGSLWDEAFDNGRLAALDELQDRFCVCMK